MTRCLAPALVWLILSLAMPARAAGDVPLLDATAVPNQGTKGRAAYNDFLLTNLPRAFAVSADGHFGWSHNNAGIAASREDALKACAATGGSACAIYAEDLRVVWPGRDAGALPPVPGALMQNGVFAIVADQRFIWRGPKSAFGLYVWAHGKSGLGADERGEQPQPYVRAFNNFGFDVVRFDRDPRSDDPDDAAAWLRTALPALRRMGWRKIIVGGQSRGAWNALQMLSDPRSADAVIAVSPANFGGITTSDRLGDLYTIMRSAAAPAARVAVVQFKGDIYVRDLDHRASVFQDVLAPRVGAFLLIDQPPGITGHGGANGSVFAVRYANCLLHFVIDAVPVTACAPSAN